MIRPSAKEQLHARNRFRTGYDFARLVVSSPRLAAFVSPNAYGDAAIDYANPEAVKALNCIYPLIGAREYGWRLVGTEIDPAALPWAEATCGGQSGSGQSDRVPVTAVAARVFQGRDQSG